MPYLTQTAQETLLEWYDRGLDLFRDSCSAGYMILETFRDRLLPQLNVEGSEASREVEERGRIGEPEPVPA